MRGWAMLVISGGRIGLGPIDALHADLSRYGTGNGPASIVIVALLRAGGEASPPWVETSGGIADAVGRSRVSHPYPVLY